MRNTTDCLKKQIRDVKLGDTTGVSADSSCFTNVTCETNDNLAAKDKEKESNCA